MQQSGAIHHIGQTENVGSNGFYKRTLVISFKDGNYDKLLAIDFPKDKGDKLNNLQIGQNVTVHFNLDSREYNGKYYTQCSGWKIESAQPTYSGTMPTTDQFHPANQGGASDDLPF